MEIETLDGKTSQYLGDRSVSSSLFRSDLPDFIKNMRKSSTWENGELSAVTLLNNPCKQIVLVVMHEKTEVESFQSGESTTFQIIEGRMKFQTGEETVIMGKGQLLTLHDKVNFSLTTLEESVLLLTILTYS